MEGIMRCGDAMSRASRLNGRQIPSLLLSEKDEEKFLPTCVHSHVAKSKRLAQLAANLAIHLRE
jgi:hypothetical protein